MSDVRFTQVVDGKPWVWKAGSHYEECCDCGLIHKVRYIPVDEKGRAIKGARVHITVWRDKKHTTKRRKDLRLRVLKGTIIAS